MTLLPVLTSDGMRAAEAVAIGEWGIPARVLMETAGRAAADVIAETLSETAGARVAVLAGAGNNGGDGLVAARVLHARGADVRVAVLDAPRESADRAANRQIAERLADDRLRVGASADVFVGWTPDVIVDALLGTGASGPLRDAVAPLAAYANAQPCPVVALDVPTGVDATTGAVAEGAVRADVTVGFGAAKAGALVGPGAVVSGRVVAVEIGVPAEAIEAHAAAHRATRAWVRETLPRRGADAHKYSVGQVAAVVGSRRYTGAAVLAATAAMRAGAGAVVCCTPHSAQATIDAHSAEVMVDPQAETEAGTLAFDALDAVQKRLESADAAVVGCGLGRADETQRLVRALVAAAPCPLVLDADGLRAFAGCAEALAGCPAPLVLTPHAGELSALVGDSLLGEPADRVALVRALAARWDAVVLLKGMPSVVGAPDGRVFVGPPGEPALATAGSGDTLAGTLASLLAQGLAAHDAALAALHLGSRAAQTAGPGGAGVVASDLVAALPAALAHFLA